jgi:hypothetical protein
MYGSTNDDGAFHTFVIRVILENPKALLEYTAKPLADFIIAYPSGSHTLAAFFVAILGVPIEKIVIMVSAALPGMMALAFYSLTKHMLKSRMIAIVAAFVSSFLTTNVSWVPLSWGALPSLISLYLTVNGMVIIYRLFETRNHRWTDACLAGFSFLMAVLTYPAALLYLGIWFLLLILRKMFLMTRNRKLVSESALQSVLNPKNLVAGVALLVPLLLAIPYILIVLYHSTSSLQNYPPDANFTEIAQNQQIISDLVRQRINFNWLLDIPRLSSFFRELGLVLQLGPLSLLVIVFTYLGQRLKVSDSEALWARIVRNLAFIYVFPYFLLVF